LAVWLKATAFVTVLSGLAVGGNVLERAALAQRRAPSFQVDPMWPKVPRQWMLGQVAGLAVDARDHVWIIQRPWSLADDEKASDPAAPCCHAAPPVMEFDSDGAFVQGWGGLGDGYEWPADEHTIHVDYKGNVWISSAGGPRLPTKKENQILKFTQSGKFLMQIGHRGMSKGSLDTDNFNNAADIYVYAKTNEVFVADGYVNRRMPNRLAPEGPGPQQFNLVHGVRVSDDGLVYVADRRNNRLQVFTTDGKFQREIFVERATKLLGTSFSVAFSPGPAQELLFLADAGNGRVHVFDRRSLEEVGTFGRIGHYAGEFVFLHNVAVDSKGNMYTAEVGNGKRVQKFLRR
jgi:hypothetical protein